MRSMTVTAISLPGRSKNGTYPWRMWRGIAALLLAMLIGACTPDPGDGIAEIRLTNDSGRSVHVQGCTFTCQPQDLDPAEEVDAGASTSLRASGDPCCPTPYVVRKSNGSLSCIIASAAHLQISVTSGRPIKSAKDCHA